jgi:purine-binding chemotaxis protein CheW
MSTTTIEQQIVVFALSAEEYALPIENVQEIIRYAEPRAVASPEPSIRGVISLRGRIVPVVDLALRLGLVAEPADEQKIVIVELDGGTVGVVVDDVEEVLTIDASQLDEIPGANSDAIDAIAKLGDRLVALLNPDRLLGGLGDTA